MASGVTGAVQRLAKGGVITDQLNIDAANQVEAELRDAIATGKSIGVETVLSSPKYQPLVGAALNRGYRVMLHYVLLAEPALHVVRVGQRVAQGGHGIPAKKIADRFARSLDQLPWFAKQATLAFIWDNSLRAGALDAIPLIAEKAEDGSWQAHVASDSIEDMDDNVLHAFERIGIKFE